MLLERGRVYLGGLVLLLIVGCAATSNLPTHSGMSAMPTALMTGELVLDGECLYINGDARRLVIWPQGFSLHDGVLHHLDESVAKLGDTVILGGGEYKAEHYDFLRTYLNMDVPLSCSRERFWLASTVEKG